MSVPDLMSSRTSGVARWLSDDARRAGLRPGTAWLVFWTPLLGWLLLGLFFVLARPWFYLVLQEDQPVEWAQFALCLFTAIVAAVAAVRTVRQPRAGGLTLALAALALGMLFLAGEEISWAQRVLGIETPAALAEANQQREANLHNVNVGVDPQLLFKLASVGLGLAGLVAIVVGRIRDGGGKLLRELAPPAVTAPGFAGIVGYWVIMAATDNSLAPLLRFQEWVECSLYISCAAALVSVLVRADPSARAVRFIRWAGLAVALLTVLFAVLTAVVGMKPGNV